MTMSVNQAPESKCFSRAQSHFIRAKAECGYFYSIALMQTENLITACSKTDKSEEIPIDITYYF